MLRTLQAPTSSARVAERADRPGRTQDREVGPMLLERAQRGLQRRLQLVDAATELAVAAAQGGHLVLELEDAAYALEADAGRGQLGDLAQQLDVAQRVAP